MTGPYPPPGPQPGWTPQQPPVPPGQQPGWGPPPPAYGYPPQGQYQQGQYPQPMYGGMPQQPARPAAGTNALSVIGLVVALASLVLALVIFRNLAVPVGLVGLLLSSLGAKQARSSGGSQMVAIFGIVLGTAAVLVVAGYSIFR